MKKIITVLLIVVMSFTLCACRSYDIPDKFVADKESLSNKAFIDKISYDDAIDYDMTLTFREGDSTVKGAPRHGSGSFTWKLDLVTASSVLDDMYWDWVWANYDKLANEEITLEEYEILDEYEFDDWYDKIYLIGSEQVETENQTDSYLMCSGTYVVDENGNIVVTLDNNDCKLDRLDTNTLTFFMNSDNSLELELNDNGKLYTLNFIVY